MEKVIFGIDQSTSGSKFVVVDHRGKIIYKDALAHKQIYPEPGFVEHDMEEILENCLKLIEGGLAFIEGDYEPINLSITNQRETIVFWNKVTGEPLYNALVWQCRRGSDICKEMTERGIEGQVKEKTGLKLDPYFSGSKIKWAIDNIPAVQRAQEVDELLIGTVDSYLVYRLTGGISFQTDHTNASRTLLYNIHTNDWDEDLMTIFGVDRQQLPAINSSNGHYGYTSKDLVGISLPIMGVIGDSQGALYGQMCFKPGDSKATYGTGSSLMMYTGEGFISSDKGIMTSIAWSDDWQIHYCIEGMINSSGDTLKWVKDNLGLYQDDWEIEASINALESSEGVYIVPAFSGLGAPYWSPDARAGIVGMTRKSNKTHIIRAAVESMAYQVADLIHLMASESGKKITVLNVDGGPTKNAFLMQLQADLLDIELQCGSSQELSVLGAVYMAGLKNGFWPNIESLLALKEVERKYPPKMSVEDRTSMMGEWHKAVKRLL